MLRLAVVTGSEPPDGIDLATMAASDDLLVEALAMSADIAEPSWRDHIDWSMFDAVLVRTVWDYVEHRDAFVEWAHSVGQIAPLFNDADVMRWNTHKRYLIELEERGAPIIPTAWLAHGDQVDVGALASVRGWSHVIIKPAVSTGSRGVLRTSTLNDEIAQHHIDMLLASGDVLVQPYLSSVETRGECSVVVIDGTATHAVRKLPQSGDFRVQHEYGGTYQREPLTRELATFAEWVVEATGNPLLFARVDVLEGELGALQLVELEATEPDLFLSLAGDQVGVIADAVLRRCKSVR